VYIQIQHKCNKTTPKSSKSSWQKQCAIAANKQPKTNKRYNASTHAHTQASKKANRQTKKNKTN
jgi:hypothetical protein